MSKRLKICIREQDFDLLKTKFGEICSEELRDLPSEEEKVRYIWILCLYRVVSKFHNNRDYGKPSISWVLIYSRRLARQ